MSYSYWGQLSKGHGRPHFSAVNTVPTPGRHEIRVKLFAVVLYIFEYIFVLYIYIFFVLYYHCDTSFYRAVGSVPVARLKRDERSLEEVSRGLSSSRF